MEHNKVIRREFTKQAVAYASNPSIVDSEWALRLVDVTQPSPDSRVLEVATGPGYVALAFAVVCRQVVGVDLTDAPLAHARRNQAERGLANVSFVSADARRLPFENESFDVTVCRLAFHHFEHPEQVLAEMVRVCRSGGTVSVEDLTASEDPKRAAVYNQWERLRDPSHVAALSLGQLVGRYREVALEIENVRSEQRPQDVEGWLGTAGTEPQAAQQVRLEIQNDWDRQSSGTPIYRDQDGRLCFVHRMVTVVGRKR